MKLGVIVEGHGEVEAAPVLLRRIMVELLGRHDVEILRPDRRKRGQLDKQEGFSMTRGYTETLDQPAFAALVDLEQAQASYSFDKLIRELKRITNNSPDGSSG